jgi:hypothetical protein
MTEYFDARAWGLLGMNLQQIRYLDQITTKLNGIETAATADQTDAEVETAYNNQVSVVTQALAEAGVSSTVYRWTPLRVAQAIAALGAGLSDGDKGDIVVSGGGTNWQLDASIAPKRTIGVVFDGGGSPPTAGSVGFVVAQFPGSIDRWDIVGDVSGSAVVDVWKAAGAIPTDANRIAGTEKLTLAASQLANDSNLTTWSTLAVAVGDVIGFELESVTTCTRVTAQVRIAETI